MRLILFIFLLPLLAFGAVNSTTPGPMITLSTFECISVRAWYTNDANNDNSATIQFKRTADSTWLNAYTPIIDKRAEVVIQGTTNLNTTNQFQARGSVVGLVPNTSYDVKLIWSDPDGIVGAASITNTISTLSYSVPTNGTTVYVDGSAGSEGSGTIGSPYKTITNAIQQSSAGTTIVVAPGDYVSMTISKSGTSSAYFVVTTNGAGQCSIQGGAAVNSLTMAASYWVIDGFNLEQSTRGGLHFNSGASNIYVMHTLQTNAVSSSGVFCAAVEVYGNPQSSIFLISNNWSCWNPQITNDTAGLVDMVDFSNGQIVTFVVAYNYLQGGWDAIGNRGNSSFNGMGENTDFCHNTITDNIDDVFEVDGSGPNIRVFDNHVNKGMPGFGNYGGSLFSDAGTYIGPMYVFRNFLHGYGTNALGNSDVVGIKTGGHSAVGWAFYFHNTIVTTSSGGGHEVVSEAGYNFSQNATTNHTFRNNIFFAAGNVYWTAGTNNSHDYDLGFTINGGNFAGNWNGASNYTTFANFQAGTGEESHGLGSNPLLDLTTLTIPTNSPAVDTGVVLANFNDANSAWPFTGSAPDMGAFEAGGNPPPGPTYNATRAFVGRIVRAP